MWWNSGTVMVEQCWWNSETVIVEQWNSVVEECWWNSGTVIVEQCWCNSVVEQSDSEGGTVEQ